MMVFENGYIRSFFGYIDVGDGCWRPNVLVTSLRCWWSIQNVGDRFNTFACKNNSNLEMSVRQTWFIWFLVILLVEWELDILFVPWGEQVNLLTCFRAKSELELGIDFRSIPYLMTHLSDHCPSSGYFYLRNKPENDFMTRINELLVF